MQIQKFRLFVEEIQRNADFLPVRSWKVYRQTDRSWIDHTGETASNHQNDFLNETIQKDEPWRPTNSTTVYYPIKDLAAVAITESKSAPKKRTYEAAYKIFKASLVYANTAFNANYCSLTGLQSGILLDKTLNEAILKGSNSYDQKDAASLASQKSTVCVLLLDIDFFKQINDSYGHGYGDAVLAAFAKRTNDELVKFTSRFSDISASLSRPSGEEFYIVLSGPITETIANNLAEHLNDSIRKDPLPSTSEWNHLTKINLNTGLKLPSTNERHVTASIGISSIISVNPTHDVNAVKTQLKREADTALYRAKSASRDTFRYFPTIRQFHGRLIEHHPETKIVAIDIGSQVGVRLGDEFLVMHPDFTGQKNFIISDGRSKKILGKYPRVPHGRIVVFDAQPEISFCRAEESHNCILALNSLLEQIPLGSISHLLNTLSHEAGLGNLNQPDKLKKELESLDESNTFATTIVFSLQNHQDLAKASGTSAVNRALGNLVQSLQVTLPVKSAIAQVGSTMFATIIHPPMAENWEELVKNVITASEKKCGGMAKFSAGVSSEKKLRSEATFRIRHSLDYALYAASPYFFPKNNPIIEFTHSTALNLLYELRVNFQNEQAVTDYRNFQNIGVTDGNIDNLAAVCMVEQRDPDFDGALVAIRSAVDKLNDVAIVHANAGAIEYANGDFSRADQEFSTAARLSDNGFLPDVYRPYRASAAYQVLIAEGKQRADLLALVESGLEALAREEFLQIPLVDDLSAVKAQLESASAKFQE